MARNQAFSTRRFLLRNKLKFLSVSDLFFSRAIPFEVFFPWNVFWLKIFQVYYPINQISISIFFFSKANFNSNGIKFFVQDKQSEQKKQRKNERKIKIFKFLKSGSLIKEIFSLSSSCFFFLCINTYFLQVKWFIILFHKLVWLILFTYNEKV